MDQTATSSRVLFFFSVQTVQHKLEAIIVFYSLRYRIFEFPFISVIMNVLLTCVHVFLWKMRLPYSMVFNEVIIISKKKECYQ